MDEFDVFLDAVSRRIALSTMVSSMQWLGYSSLLWKL